MKRVIGVLVVVAAAVAAFFLLSPASVDEIADNGMPPEACDALKAAGIEQSFGAGKFLVNEMPGSDGVTVTMCSYVPADTSVNGLSLILNVEDASQPERDSVQLRDAEMSKLKLVLNDDTVVKAEPVGEAAIWIDEMHMMTVWTQQGRVMIQLSGTGGGDHDSFTVLAEEIAKQF